MSFTKIRQKPGPWSVKLRASTPQSVIDMVDPRSPMGFATVFVSAVDMPAEHMTRGKSIYSGMLRGRTGRSSISGDHIGAWIGDDQGKGAWPLTNLAAIYLQDHVNQILPWIPGFSAGILPPKPGPGLLDAWVWTNDHPNGLRSFLDRVCAGSGGCEWEATDDFKLNVGTVASLYNATSPVILTSGGGGGGRDVGGPTGIRCTITEPGADVEDYANYEAYTYDNAASPDALDLTLPGRYVDPQGWSMVMKRKADYPALTDPPAAADLATANLTAVMTPHQSLDVRTDQHALLAALRVGQAVTVHAPDLGLTGTVPIAHRGLVGWGMASRVEAVTMPWQAGMGLFIQRGNGAFIRLTEHIEPEPAGARIVLGDLPRGLRRR